MISAVGVIKHIQPNGYKAMRASTSRKLRYV
jgi:hypothetical protein